MLRKFLKITVLIIAVLLLCASILVFLPAPWLPIWVVRIFITEWSWILCLLAILIAFLAGGNIHVRMAALAAALVYLVPVVQLLFAVTTQKLAFSVSNPFLPKGNYDHVAFGGNGRHLDFYPSSRVGVSPCVVVIHGGGWRGGDTGELAGMNLLLARKGHAVAVVSYRFAPRHPWPAAYEDVVAAVKFLRANAEKFHIDPDCIVLLGRSAGGQLAADLATRKAVPGIRGCICLYSPFDMEFAYKYGDENDILNSPQLLRDYLGGNPQSVSQSYRDASPIFFVNPDTVPFLLIHGARDELVWVEQSRRFSKRLQENGVKHRTIELPWATHGFDFAPLGPGRAIAMDAVMGFLNDVCASGEQERDGQ